VTTFYERINVETSQKAIRAVTPAEAGVQKSPKILDSRLRGNDRKRRFLTFHVSVILGVKKIGQSDTKRK